MDRRQRKTRTAIFEAFISLISEKSFDKITVGEIIEKADVGRATFYAHFETKDFLLKELCDELFCHLFDSMSEETVNHRHIFDCDTHDSVFLHLMKHLEKNDNRILDLLSCPDNTLFMQYFKKGLSEIIKTQKDMFFPEGEKNLPDEFLVNHIASSFVETVVWWIKNGRKESPEEINQYFLCVTGKR